MPEGPEIRRAADRLETALRGKQAVDVRFAFERLEPYEEELRGRVVRAVEPRGKALLTRFEGGWNVYSHNQLYGRWYVRKAGSLPRTGRTLRFEVHTRRHWALLYSASEIEVLRDEELAAHPFLARLGPDLLHPRTTPARIRARLEDPRFARRKLGHLLLDQAFLAGTGNYLRSETLFFAGVHPDRRPRDLNAAELELLARELRRVVRRAYRQRGVTNLPVPVAEGKAAGLPRRAWRHAVFGRAGQPCFTCGAPVRQLTVSGRRLFVCEVCQPR